MKTAGPALSLPVTDKEKQNARAIRNGFENVLRKQDGFIDYLNVLFDQLDVLDEKAGLGSISPLLKRYEHKMRKVFNSYINSLSNAVSVYERNFSDSELDNIRDLIIENVRNMRQEVIDLLVLMKDVSDSEFVPEAKKSYEGILNAAEQIENTIRDEWFSHIDYDILGKIRLGSNIPLYIKRG